MQLSCPKLRADQDPFQNFKFRINAFKNAFFEEAKRIGTMQNLFLPLLTPRSIKEYVDSTPYIAKFVKNHKIKSKGYECYQVDGQLFPDRWVFRVFRADFSETTPPTAYCGELYLWEPIISDPKLCNLSFSTPSNPIFSNFNLATRMSRQFVTGLAGNQRLDYYGYCSFSL